MTSSTDDSKEDIASPEEPSPPPQFPLAMIKDIVHIGCVALAVLWFVTLWMYGSVFRVGDHAKNLNCLFADYDGGFIGQALRDAVDAASGTYGNPTITLTTVDSAELQRLVWEGKAWGAIWANEGMSEAFKSSLAGTTNLTYNASFAYTYTALPIRYFSAYESYIFAPLTQVGVKATGYAEQLALDQDEVGSEMSKEQLKLIGSPASATYLEMVPFGPGLRILFNSLGTAYPFLFQFFFIINLNGILQHHRYLTTHDLSTYLRLRYIAKIAWTLLTSLVILGVLNIFDEQGWYTDGKQFVGLWAALWTLCLINFSTISTILTLVPLRYVPFFIGSIVMTSVSSTMLPIELRNGFYRLLWLFPARSYYNTAITVLGRGAVNYLHIYLPILAAWIVVGEVAEILCAIKAVRRGKTM